MNSQRKHAPRLLKLCGLAAALFAPSAAPAQPTPTPTPYRVDAPAAAAQDTEIQLRWRATPRVSRYRLQVARDPRFSDILFDGLINGLEHKVTGLPTGRYYWRVAPAPNETGRFRVGEVVESIEASAASASPVPTPAPSARPALTPAAAASAAVLRSPRDIGWQAAIGKVQRPVPARLRPGQSFDLLAANSDGTVYALEGATGAALWTARSRATAAGGAQPAATGEVFTPLVYNAAQRETANVVAAFDGGVRMLEGETGRELWRAALAGRPASGAVGEFDGNAAAPEIALVTTGPSQLYVIEGATGRVISRTGLPSNVVGVPVPFQADERRGVAITLEGGQLDVLKSDGTRLHGVRFDVPFVTPPLIIAGPQGTVVIVGTAHGLLFLSGADLKPLGRITTENDAPRGRLAAADLDGDRALEIVMVTRRGRVAVISVQGKINWSAEGGADAYTASFADLDRDGQLDVIVADESVFARGFSGRDGKLVWQADDDVKGAPAGAGGDAARALRSVAVASFAGSGTPLIVGGDPARNTVRAVGLPAAGGRAAAR